MAPTSMTCEKGTPSEAMYSATWLKFGILLPTALMRKIVALVAVAVMWTGVARADNGWGVFASYWDTKDAGDGPGLGIKFSIEGAPHFLVDIKYTYYDDLGESVPDAGITSYKLNVQPIELGMSFVGQPSERMDVFGGGGIGYYLMQGEIRTQNTPGITYDISPNDAVGFYLNAGLEFVLAAGIEGWDAKRATLFLEGMYRLVKIDEVSAGGLSYPVLEGDLNGLSANVGFMLRW